LYAGPEGIFENAKNQKVYFHIIFYCQENIP